MEVIGTIKKIGDVQQITPTFSKRELVLVTDGMYPQTLLIEYANSRVSVLDAFQTGQFVKASIDLRGREWNNPATGEIRYFVSISGWKLEPWQPGTPADGGQMPPQQAVPASNSAPAAAGEPEDDLPF